MMKVGKNFQLGEYVVIRYDEDSIIGDNCRISDFCRITARLEFGDYIEVASHCSIAGGGGRLTFTMKGYSSLSSGVKIWLSSNDYRNELVTHGLDGVKEITGPVTIDKYCGIGSNSVVMPNNHIPEGVCIGAMSFVPTNFQFEPWTLYAGIPIRKICNRDKDKILSSIKL